MAGARRRSREYALQMLFQWDITHDDIASIAENFFEGHSETPTAIDFAKALAVGAVDQVEKIDALIQRHAQHWRLDRMAVVDRNILRVAVGEMLLEKETPKSIVIDEAIEIARRFSTEESPQFINGILDSIGKELDEQ